MADLCNFKVLAVLHVNPDYISSEENRTKLIAFYQHWIISPFVH